MKIFSLKFLSKYLLGFFLLTCTTAFPALNAFWRFNENTGSTVNDVVGTNHLTLTSGSIPNFWSVAGEAAKFFPPDVSDLKIPSNPALDITGSISISAWIKPTVGATIKAIVAKQGATAAYRFVMNNMDKLEFGFTNGASNFWETAPTLSLNVWHHVVVTYDEAAAPQFYIDNLLVGTTLLSGGVAPMTTNTNDLMIGAADAATPTDRFDGSIGHVRLYNSIINSTLIDSLFNNEDNFVNTDPVLKAFWKFDENSGSTINDYEGTPQNGTAIAINTTTFWNPAGQSALFDGIDDFVDVVHNSDLDKNGSITITAWVKFNSAGALATIVAKKNATDNNYFLYRAGSNKIRFDFFNSSNNSFEGTSALATNTWYHIAVTYDGSTSPKIYINGVDDGGSFFSGTAVPMLANTEPLRIGRDGTTGTGYLNGNIGHARLYSGILSQTEIDSIRTLEEPIVVPPAPVGFWKFSENTGTMVGDSSGTANNGTATGISIPNFWSPPKHSAQFDGIDDYISINDAASLNITGNITIAAWVKFDTLSPPPIQYILAKGNNTMSNYGLYLENDRIRFTFNSNLNVFENSSSILKGRWYFIALKYDGSTNPRFYINGVYDGGNLISGGIGSLTTNTNILALGKNGQAAGNYFKGQMGYARIYNSLLPDTDITRQYKKDMGKIVPEPPAIAFWPFIENAGTSIGDSSGLGNHGTAVAINTTSFWDIPGQRALFDGIDDFVNVPDAIALDIENQISISAWVKFNMLTGPRNIISKKSDINGNYSLRLNTANEIEFEYYSNGTWNRYRSSMPVSSGVMYHLAVTYDGQSNVKIYIDTTLTSGSWVYGGINSLMTDNNPVYIGAAAAASPNYFDGQIGHVRLFDIELDSSDVHKLYTLEFRQVQPLAVAQLEPGDSLFSTVLNSSGIFSNQDSVVMLQIKVGANPTDQVLLDTLKIKNFKGDPNKVSATDLYRDMNNNGLLDAADFFLDNRMIGADSIIRFSKTPGVALDSMNPNSLRNYIVVYHFGPNILSTDTFQVKVDSTSIVGRSKDTNLPFKKIGNGLSGINGVVKFGKVGSLSLALGSFPPADGGIFSNQDSVIMTNFELFADPTEKMMVDSIYLKNVKGPSAKVMNVILYKDVTDDGLLNTGDAWLTSNFINGTDSLIALGMGASALDSINAGTANSYLVVYDFGPNILPTDTFQVKTPPVKIKTKGKLSNIYNNVSGTDVFGANKFGQVGSVSLNAGDIIIPNGGVFSFEDSVEMIQFKLTAGALEDIKIDTLYLKHLQGPTAKVSGVKVYTDMNNNGLIDAGDLDRGFYSIAADSGIYVYGFPFDTIYAGTSKDYLLSYNFGTYVNPADTFRVSMTSDSVKARGKLSNIPIAATGTAFSGASKFGLVGALNLALGTFTPSDGGIFSNQDSVAMIQIYISADPTETAVLDSLHLKQIKGPTAKVTMAAIYLDANVNGTLDGGDSYRTGAPMMADSTVSFGFAGGLDTIYSGTTKSFLITYHFGLSVSQSDTFQFRIDAGMIKGTGINSYLAVNLGGGPLFSANKFGLVGSIAQLVGPAMPINSTIFSYEDSVEMMQLEIAAGSVEAMLVDSIKLKHLQGPTAKVWSVDLYRDYNNDGEIDAGDGFRINTSINGDSIINFYLSGWDSIPANGSINYLIAYNFNTSTLNELDTFQLNIQSSGVYGRGRNSNVSVASTGGAINSALKTGQTGSLTLLNGAPVPDGGIFSNQDSVTMLHFSLSANNIEAIYLDSIHVKNISGPLGKLSMATLFKDMNSNGMLDENDQYLYSSSVGADSVARFNAFAMDTIPQSTTHDYLITYHFGSNISDLDSFQIMLSSAMIFARGVQSYNPVLMSGGPETDGIKFGLTGGLSLAQGDAVPSDGGIFSNQSYVVMSQFTLAANPVEDILIDSIRIKHLKGLPSGVVQAKLFKDLDNNGQKDSTDQFLHILSINAPDSLIYFGGYSLDTVPAGMSSHYLVLYDFASGITPSDTFQIKVSDALIRAVGKQSGNFIGVSGGDILGANRFGQRGDVTLTAGINNPGDSPIFSNADSVVMMQLNVSAGPVEDVLVDSMVAKVFKGDLTKIVSGRLFDDQNVNGVIDDGEPQIGSLGFKNMGDSTIHFGFGPAMPIDSLAAGTSKYYIALVDFSGPIFTSDTFQIQAFDGRMTGKQSGLELPISAGLILGGKKFGQKGSLILTMGPNPPLDGNVYSYQDTAILMQFRLDASSSIEQVRVNSINFEKLSGSSAQISSAELFQDVDGSGLLNDVDILVDNNPFYGTSTIQFNKSGALNVDSVALASYKDYIVRFSFSGKILTEADTFRLRLYPDSILVQGALSDLNILPGGITVLGPQMIGQNALPEITSASFDTASEDMPFTYLGSGTDLEGPVTISFANIPSWLTVFGNSVSGTPLEGTPDTSFLVIATDDVAQADTNLVSISVLPFNDAPVISSAPTAVATEDELFTYTANVIDSDGPTLAFVFENLPAWLTASGNSVTGTPVENDSNTSFTVIASDGIVSDTLSIALTVNPVNDAPVITSPASDMAIEDIAFSYIASANDVDDSSLTFSFINLPSWMAPLGPAVVSGLPVEGTADTSFTVIATDGLLSDTLVVNLTVNPVNDAPVITSASLDTAFEDSIYQYIATASDVDGPSLYVSFANLPSWLNASGNIVYGTPSNEMVDTSFTVIASDGVLNDTVVVSLMLGLENDPPVITSADQDIATEDVAYQYAATAVDIDGPALTFSFNNLPAWFTANGNRVSGTPLEGMPDTSFTVIASDGFLADTLLVALTVIPVNDPPVMTSRAVETATEDVAYSYTATATDIENDALSFSFIGLPAWLSTVGATVSGTPLSGDPSTTFSAIVSDGLLQDTLIISLTVNPVNDAPRVISGGAITAMEDQAFEYIGQAEDVDSPQPQIFYLNIPAWALVNGDTLLGTPQEGDLNTTFQVVAFDGSLADTMLVMVTVLPVNDSPQITSAVQVQAVEDELFRYGALVEDPDGPALQISYFNFPAWLSVINDTLQGTPENNITEAVFTVLVTDGELSDQKEITIQIRQTNDAPTLSLPEGVIDIFEDVPHSFTVEAADIDAGQSLQFSLIAGAAGDMTVNSLTGIFSFTPTNSEVGSHSVVMTATDPEGASAVDTLILNVINVNDAPELDSMTELSADEDAEFSVTIQGRDSDLGDLLSYTMLGGQSGNMNLNPATGEMSWTPTNEEVGDHILSVQATDQEGLGAIREFNIRVNNSNDAPTLDPLADVTAMEDALLSLQLTAGDIDGGDSLHFTIELGQTGDMSISPAGLFEWTPTNEDVGTHTIIASVADLAGLSVSDTFVIEVFNSADFPNTVIEKLITNLTAVKITAHTEDQDTDDSIHTVTAELYRVETNDSLLLMATQIHNNPAAFVFAPLYAGHYSIRLYAQDQDGLIDPTPAEQTFEMGDYLTIQFQLPGWQMIGLPGETVETSNFGFAVAAEDSDMNLFAYDPTRVALDNFYGGYIKGSELSSIERGRAYWLKTVEGTELTIHNPLSYDPHYSDFNMALAAGWNLESNPFPFEIQAPEGLTFWAWNGISYEAAPVLMPWIGYWVESLQDTILTLMNKPYFAEEEAPLLAKRSKIKKTNAVNDKDWFLTLRAAGDKFKDTDNRLGFNPLSSDGKDRLDLSEPPRSFVAHSISLFLKQGDKRLASDIRKTLKPVNLWEVGFEGGNIGEILNIQFDQTEIQNIDAKYSLYLLDRGKPVDLRQTANYQVKTAAKTQYFTIVVTDQPDYINGLTQSFALYQNYPNPFNPSTTIAYAIPVRWLENGLLDQTPVPTKLKIYNMSGQLVKTLIDRSIPTGFHQIVWDGKANHGKEISTGVYFYRLQVDHLTLTRKMIVVK